eukprot:11208506-Lingulodinium_polyedra.AAC.1
MPATPATPVPAPRRALTWCLRTAERGRGYGRPGSGGTSASPPTRSTWKSRLRSRPECAP